MNVALASIAVLFLLSPGIIFRRCYYTGVFSQQYFKSSFSDLLISTIIPSLVIHVILYHVIIKPDYELDIKSLAMLFSGTSEVPEIYEGFKRLFANSSSIIKYLLFAAGVSAVLGKLAQLVIRRTNLDKTTKFFRFQNQWHYLFSGEILDFKSPGYKTQVDILSVDALVDTNYGSVIYSGILYDYILGKDSGMDRIYLREVKRRFLKDDPKPQGIRTPSNIPNAKLDDPYYQLPGDFFVLSFNQIKNLHITYYSAFVEEEGQNVT